MMIMEIMMIMKNTQIGSNPEVVSYKNILTGETVLSPKKSNSRFIDGIEFIQIFNPAKNTINFMRKDSLRRIQTT
jgi:hypothetical protein